MYLASAKCLAVLALESKTAKKYYKVHIKILYKTLMQQLMDMNLEKREKRQNNYGEKLKDPLFMVYII